jgi:hypothetical protein
VKYCFLALACGAFAFAEQSNSIIYMTDLNGHVVPEAQYLAHDGDKAQLTESINGRQVPLQSSETRVLTNEPNHRVTETIVRKYDPTGSLVTTERTIADEQKSPSGSTVHATVFRSDLNGHMQESEGRVVETRIQGATTTAAVTISRPGLNGSLEPVEKRDVVTVTEGDTIHATENIERRSGNGGDFAEAARQVREETKTPGKTTSSTAFYELDYQGKMALSRQDVATTTKTGPGAEVTELEVYSPSVYGIAREGDGPPKLREQQTTERRESGGTVTETTTVRRATISDPNRLGDAATILTVVCTGVCKGPLPTAGSKP